MLLVGSSCLNVGEADSVGLDVSGTGVAVGLAVPGTDVAGEPAGATVTPLGKKYTSSMNTAPMRPSGIGGNTTRLTGLYLYENVMVCGPGAS